MDQIFKIPWTLNIFRICPNCHRWFAMRLAEKIHQRGTDKLATFRCKRCGAKATLAPKQPPDAN